MAAKVKGTNVVEVVRLLRSNRDRAAGMLPEGLHHYLEQRILVSDWYPEDDLLELLRAGARLLRDPPDPDIYQSMGRMTARHHLNDSYRTLARNTGWQAAARRAAALWQLQHDTGRMRMEIIEAGRAYAEVTGFGLPSFEMCNIVGGYIVESMTLAGCRNVAIAKELCAARGDDRCRWSVTFDTGTSS